MASKQTGNSSRGNRAASQEGHTRFNLATMSGVFPGTRTQIYQRVQVEETTLTDSVNRVRRWLQLMWFEAPMRLIAYPLTNTETATNTEPFFVLEFADNQPFAAQLQRALAHRNVALRACGSCRYWRSQKGQSSTEPPVGQCTWPVNGEQSTVPDVEGIAMLKAQSALAPACRHWLSIEGTERPADSAAPDQWAEVATMRRAAEDAEIRRPVLQRWRRRVGRWLRSRLITQSEDVKHQPTSSASWQAELVERSGLGAGTEPCLVCQGRIANIGALTVATPEDDKQTFSVWRCRNCYALYLNSWIDRWERLDNLETEESYYRIAPDEATELLTVINEYRGGEHPHRRHERAAARQFFTDFLGEAIPLSHQVRQGR